MAKTRAEVTVHGRVQGVGYRWAAVSRAREGALAGWVCNELDGSVLCRVEGPAEAVEAFAGWCLKGPSGSRVKRVIRREVLSEGELPVPFALKH